MHELVHPTQRLDRMAIGLSGVCLVHCVATTVFVAVVASAGSILGSPLFHEIGLSIAMLIGALALGRGIQEHGFMMPSAVGGLGLGIMAGALSLPEGGHEVLYTMTGVLTLAFGHRLNAIASE